MIAGGISPGMQVVVAGVHVLSPGQKVTIYHERAAAPAAATPAEPGVVKEVVTTPVDKPR